MDSEEIIQDLNRRFAAPLPEFYKRRIVVWIDEDAEFADKLDEITLSGAKVVALTGSNNFYVKKLLAVDDPTGNYLVYRPFAYESDEDNWLLDMELYGEEFHADLVSMWMDEMGIPQTPALRRGFKQYRKFFNAQARRNKVSAQASEESGSGQNDPDHYSERTSERIAREIGKGEKYVRRAEEFARGIDAAEEAVPGIKHEIFSGEIHPPDNDIVAVARAPSEERKALAEQLRHPEPAKKSSMPTFQNEDIADDDDEEAAVEFKPSTASILAISEGMDSSSARSGSGVDTEFIILELGNALESMMFRWETCINDYRKEAMAKDCQKKIKELVLEGIRYLQQYKGGVRNEAVR